MAPTNTIGRLGRPPAAVASRIASAPWGAPVQMATRMVGAPGRLAADTVQVVRRRRVPEPELPPETGAHQVALTVRAPVRPRAVQSLKRVLHRMATGTAEPRIRFEDLSGVHFARLLLLKQSVDPWGALIPPSLVLLSDVDAPLERHLGQLTSIAGPGLDAVLSHCAGYPRAPTKGERLAYLRRHTIPAQTVYVNTVGRTVAQVGREARLREAIQDFLDARPRAARSPGALGLRAEIQEFVGSDPDLRWALEPAPRPSAAWRMKEALHMAAVPLEVLAASPLVVPALPIWALLLRRNERRSPAPHLKPDEAHVSTLVELEDWVEQNPFSAIGYIKPGRLRRVTVRGVLWLASYATRHVYNDGNLAGVKTIHFARWIVLDGDRRVLFASNYDGSLESYMDDFIDKVAWGLNAVFGNGIGYPRTRWLFFDGAHDEQAFKDFLRRHEIPTQVWYSAYDQLSARNIQNNARIRAGLSGTMSEADAEAWLARL